MIKEKDLGEEFEKRLKRRRQHRKNWQEPEDAYLILNLHFNVYSYERSRFHAEATLEIPTKQGFDYTSITATAKTRAGALRLVIEQMENSLWFKVMRDRQVRFRVTGAGMEELYRGYL